MLLTADPDADLEGALAAGRRYRRGKRVAEVHVIDALYQAYVTALIGAGILYLLATLVGDERLGPDQLADVATHGADWLGAVAAGVVALGLRSGARGGPLALERAEVRHVLLAPVDRTTALRGPALRQLRFLAFVAAVVGVEAGLLASRRLEHHAAQWMAWGALFAVATVVLGYGAALCASARRLPSPVATVAGLALVSWALADGLGLAEGSPLTAWGHVGLAPYGGAWWAPVAVVASLAVLAAGLAWVGDSSLEAADRRSRLVGQLRFAATLHDVRTVIVLRRQLAMELPRVRPWLTLAVRGSGRLPVWTRGWRGVLRWPAARMARLALLGVTAGLALRGAWAGTTPLVVVAGAALYVAGLDAVESLAQEVDRPTRSRSVPVRAGTLHLRHLPVAAAVMAATGLVAALAAVAAGPSWAAVALAAACVAPAALGAVAGAATSVVSGPPDPAAWALAPPEVAGLQMAARVAWPVVLAVGGTLPVLAARWADGDGSSVVGATSLACAGVAFAFGAVAAWLNHRDTIKAAWDELLDRTRPHGSRPDAAVPAPDDAPDGQEAR